MSLPDLRGHRYKLFMGFLLAVILSVYFYQRYPLFGVFGSEVSPTAGLENIARGKSYTLLPAPNYDRCTDKDDVIQLTDGVYTNGYFWTQKSTVGWVNARPAVITLDLGQVEPIRGVSFNTAGGAGGVTWPMYILVLVSDDGVNFTLVDDLVSLSQKHRKPPLDGYAVHRYWTNEMKTYGRYVQFVVDSGVCCFVDEIEVYRGEEAWKSLKRTGLVSNGGARFYKERLTDIGIHSRLNADISEAREAISGSGLSGDKKQSLLGEVDSLELRLAQLAPVDAASFRAVLPFNELEARIFAVHGKLRQLQGQAPLQAWVSHPYDFLSPVQGPNKNAPNQLSVFMMRGEWRYATVNLTNSTDKAIKARLRIEGLPGGANPDYITVYQVEWTGTKERVPVSSALVGAQRAGDGYEVVIPAGMVRQVWLSLHPVKTAPGNYSGRVVVSSSEAGQLSVPLSFRLFPMEFPAQPTLHLGGWDYTDGTAGGVTETNRNELVRHLQERFVDSPWAAGAVLARGAFDAVGNMRTPSTQRFDEWVDRWPQARRYCIFVNAGDSLAGYKIGTAGFDARVRSWIDFWVDHAAKKGVRPEQLVLLLVDEPDTSKHEQIIVAWARAIKAAQPGVVLWEDPRHDRPQSGLQEISSAVDVLCPNRNQILRSAALTSFFQEQRTMGKRLDLYSCAGPIHLLDPYSYVRLQAWSAWVMGAESSYLWSFSDAGGGDMWQPYLAPRTNFAPMFLSASSVTPAKHMEALRESAEDYEYFVMLRKALSSANASHPAAKRANELLTEGPKRVLAASGGADRMGWSDAKDRWVAEEVRLEVLQTLLELQQGR